MNGSCTGCAAAQPRAIVGNRPGLDALVHLEGRYGDAREWLLARLSASAVPELRGLLTRASDDPSLALLDAWACLSEVLGFYHERLLNESYLRPCTERRSAVELARLVGYEPRPGVAADAYLAFTLDDLDKEARCAVPVGTRAFSQPAVGETMQPFETVEPLTGRPRWSAIRPRLTRPQRLAPGRDRLYLKGFATVLRPGDALLFEFATDSPDRKAYALRKVLGIEPQPTEQRTLVLLQPLAGEPLRESRPEPARPLDKGALARLIVPPTLQTDPPETLALQAGEVFAAESAAPLALLRSAYPALRENLAAALAGTSAAPPTDAVIVYAMRIKAAPRGYNAPLRVETTSVVTTTKGDEERGEPARTETTFTATPKEWEIDSETTDRTLLPLDAVYDQITPQSLIVVERPGDEAHPEDGAPAPVIVTRVATVATIAPTSYNLAGRVTQLTIEDPWVSDIEAEKLRLSDIRDVTVHAQNERLELADEPDYRIVTGQGIALDGLYEGLEPGRRVIVEGERCDLAGVVGVRATELVLVRGVSHDRAATDFPGQSADEAPTRPGAMPPPAVPDDALPGAPDPLRTRLTLDGVGMRYWYRRETVTIYANVARATHGESHAEVLGGGEPARALQAFALRSSPLTYISAPTATGIADTLDVRVNDLRWHEAPDAAAVAEKERRYLLFNDDDGTTRLVFGLGARLPTGSDNVRALYRSGIGREGNVRPGQINVLASRPAGVTGVTNPLPAVGGADRDGRDAIRERAPAGLVALDRLVSEGDFADFARAFGGIAKAATRYFANRNTIHVTVAAVDDAPLDATTAPVTTLRQALARHGDTGMVVEVVPHRAKFLVLDARVRLSPDFLWEAVRPAIEAALRAGFGFARRDLGQSADADEALATIQGVRGVAYATLAKFDAFSLGTAQQPLTPQEIAAEIGALGFRSVVEARVAARPAEGFRPAELVYLSSAVPATLLLSEVRP